MPRFRFWFLGTLVLVLFLAAGSLGADTLRLVYPQKPVSLDPHRWPPDPAAEPVLLTVYSRLIGLKDGRGQLDTAEGLAYTIRVSDDDLMYTVRMREGLTFSDGRPVNAEAALFSFDRLMRTEAGRNLFPRLKSFTIIGDYTFSLILDQPWPPFMASLALPQASLISPSLAERESNFLDSHTLGSGRFMAGEAGPDFLSLILRPDSPSRPKLDRAEFYFESDPQKRLALYRAKEGHLLAGPPPGTEPSSSEVLLTMATWDTRYLAFNFRRPYLGLPSVRAALTGLAKAAFAGEKFQPRGFFPAGLFAGPAAPETDGDLQNARDLLAAAGLPRGPLNLVYPGREAWARPDAEKLAAVFLEHGLKVNLVPLTGQAGQGLIEAADYDLYLGSRAPEIPSPEMWLGRFLDSRGAGRGNTAYFAREEADSLIRSFRASLPRNQRDQKTGELEVLAETEKPYVLLYQKGLTFLADQRLARQKTHPMWPSAWPVMTANLSPFQDTRTKKTEEPLPVREFDEQVAEPWD
ncbi:MAG: ABC transporter substrate-binding protein [Deltaproteobacteria bacterium]|jgi:ABC-type transport system substrate-binding protein|nr:ABC transporter substrate-binding protein [Deltaproteobacteria bacterium]